MPDERERGALARTEPGPPAEDPSAGPAPPATVPEPSTARYAIGPELARGGLGRVLRAHDRRLDRPVAMKVLLRRQGDSETRFTREAMLTARLEHPSIVPVIDTGTLPAGDAFYAMKLLEGRSLAHGLAEARGLPERLALLPHLIDVCEAMAFAHARRIIHRDLKPDNVMVGAFGETVVVDWGLAKDLDAAATADPQIGSADTLPPGMAPGPHDTGPGGLTAADEIMGTPAYMPPEQAVQSAGVDQRADVYALGSMLYHLLAGRPPFEGQRAVEVLTRLAAGPPDPLSEVEPRAPRDLVAIAEKAMARRPSDRYAQAGELAADLKKFQNGQVVGAREYGARELVVRWLRQHRLGAAVLVAVLLAGAAALGVILYNQGRLADELDEVNLARARLSLDSSPVRSLEILAGLSDRFTAWGAARTVAADAVARGLPRALRTGQALRDLALSPDGRLLAASGADGLLQLWDVERLTLGRTLRRAGGSMLIGLEFSPDGARIAAAGARGEISLWNVRTGARSDLGGHSDWVNNVVFSRDGRYLYSGSGDGTVRVWELARGTARVLRSGLAFVTYVAVSPDGRSLLAVGTQGTLLRWRLEAGLPISREPEVLLRKLERHHVTFSPDGRQLVTAITGAVEAVDLEAGTSRTLARLDVSSVALAPDGHEVIVLAPDGTVCWLGAAGGPCRQRESGDAGGAVSLASGPFSADGRLVALLTTEGGVRVIDRSHGASRLIQGHGTGTLLARFSSGRLLVTGGDDGLILLHDLDDRRTVVPGRPGGEIGLVEFSPDGQRVAWVGGEGEVWLLDLQGGSGRPVQRHPGSVYALAFSPDGRHLGSAGEKGSVRLLDLESQMDQELGRQGPLIRTIAFSPDGRWMAAAGHDGMISLWPRHTGEQGGFVASGRRVLRGHTQLVRSLAFSPDSTRLLSGSFDRTARLWAVATGEVEVVTGHRGGVQAVAFSPEGEQMATAAVADAVRLWPLSAGPAAPRLPSQVHPVEGDVSQLLFGPDGRTLLWAETRSAGIVDLRRGTRRSLRHQGQVVKLALSADGRRLASCALEERGARLWNLEDWTGQRAVEGRHLRESRTVRAVAFSSDGVRLATTGPDGGLRLWKDDLPFGPALRRWLSPQVGPRDGVR